MIAGLGIGAWLLTIEPEPRLVEGWSMGPPLPAARGELVAAVGNVRACRTPPCPESERLFVLGGLTGFFEPQASVEIFDPAQIAWAAGPALPAPRHHFAAARLGDELYVSGGTDIAGAHLGHQYWPPHNNFWRLTPGAVSWQSLSPMIEPRWGHRMVAHDGRLFVIGGRGRSGRVLIYSPSKGWSLGAELPRVRDHLSVVNVGGKLWAIGGRDPNSLARVDIYDPATDAWRAGPDLPHPTSGAAEVVLDETIFIFGGEEPDFLSGEIKDRHWSLDTRSEPPRWEPVPMPPLPVHGTNAAVLQGSIVIAGGATRHGALSAAGWTDAVQLFRPPGHRSASHSQ
jgi:N-acetylneuraminic acid mutarotase